MTFDREPRDEVGLAPRLLGLLAGVVAFGVLVWWRLR